MFATPESLDRKTGKKALDRYNYLRELLQEFETTEKEENKEQVLANFANFAYDPINYEYFRRLQVLNLFLNVVLEPASCSKPVQLTFAISAILNLCLDESFKATILKTIIFSKLIEILLLFKSERDTLCVNIMSLFIFMNCEQVKDEIKKSKNRKDFLDLIKSFINSSDKRISNAANLFFQDFNELFV